MILVDSSVWIDYFRGDATGQTDLLDILLVREPLAIGDLMLSEVLQGIDDERSFREARRMLTSLTVVDIAGQDIAIRAAQNFRSLRTLGVTIRKTIDTLIATRCIEDEHHLLYSNRDFDPFVRHLGLRTLRS